MSRDNPSYTILKEIGFRLLEEGKTVRIVAEGTSMYPTIESGSVIYIEPLKEGTKLVPGDIIAWKRESGIVVHRLIRSYEQKLQKYYVTRGDSSLAEDDPVRSDDVAGRVIRIEKPDGKPVSPLKYLGRKPNYSLNRFLVRIISQFYRIKKIF